MCRNLIRTDRLSVVYYVPFPNNAEVTRDLESSADRGNIKETIDKWQSHYHWQIIIHYVYGCESRGDQWTSKEMQKVHYMDL